jgi:hypothetical protein
MRIISKFHDYYDRAMGAGQDQSLVFVRQHQVVKDLPEFMRPAHRFDRQSRRWGIQCFPFTIGFCGRLYYGITLVARTHWSVEPAGETRHSFYSVSELSVAHAALGAVLDNETKHKKRWRNIFHTRDRFDWREFMAQPQGNKAHEQWFIENKVSIAVWDQETYAPDERSINPQLKRYEFFRVFDAFQTYQELSMFVGGVLPGASADMAVVGDKDRLAQRGFDKWSFRKMPEKKR